jgi:hypothetical protein
VRAISQDGQNPYATVSTFNKTEVKNDEGFPSTIVTYPDFLLMLFGLKFTPRAPTVARSESKSHKSISDSKANYSSRKIQL